MLDAHAPEPDRLPIPDRERWTVLRAGIQNVWEYDDRRFVFRRGRLLLRGRNEAGKTKAVELLFLAEVGAERDDFGVIAVLQPAQDHGRVETARIGEADAADGSCHGRHP
jgi:hypothetical protein